MLFTSFKFAIFLPVSFLLYWRVFSRTVKRQNVFLLLLSWLFYAFWDWKCLFLLIAVSLVSWCIAAEIYKCKAKGQTGKWLSVLNIILSVAVLFVFKYYDFFVESFLAKLGIGETDRLLIDVILPVGLSFYLFKSVSYTIDVFKGKINPEANVLNYCLYISFFPHLLAGPIERASNMLPQLSVKRYFSYNLCADACKQFLWGLFKKVVIAGNCAIYVNGVFPVYTSKSASTLVLAAVLYAFQIYADFSGYSDMAIAIGKFFGIEARKNFDMPYFSRNISEFWRKWHISLTSWFTEYVYIPLGGGKCKTVNALRNTVVVFALSGLWHGVGWNYLAWGVYHACLFVPIIFSGRKRRYDKVVAYGRTLPTLREALQMISVFLLALPGWVMFRSTGMKSMIGYFSAICDRSLLSVPYLIDSSFCIPLAISILLIQTIYLVRRHCRGNSGILQLFKMVLFGQ